MILWIIIKNIKANAIYISYEMNNWLSFAAFIVSAKRMFSIFIQNMFNYIPQQRTIDCY